MDRGEFQQDSVLKQLEVLKEEEKEFQNLKVRAAAVGPDYRDDGPIYPLPKQRPTASRMEGLKASLGTSVTV